MKALLTMRDIRPYQREPRISFPQSSRSAPIQPAHQRDSHQAKRPTLWVEPEQLQPRSKRRSGRILGWCIVALVLLGFLGWMGKVWQAAVQARGENGYQALEAAAEAWRAHDIETGHQKLELAAQQFLAGRKLLLGLDRLLPVWQHVPGAGKLTSGLALIRAGEHLTAGAQSFESILRVSLSDWLLRDPSGTASPSLLDLLEKNEPALRSGSGEFQQALNYLALVHVEDLPEERRDQFQKNRERLTVLGQTLGLSVEHVDLLEELLGKNGPRLYLFLLQNNQEARPTGGFIGTYALLDVNRGVIRRFHVEGIFEPDGQLKENIVPPAPIQKISAGWSLHDSNWFPDFPTSARKAMFFYEKTGGPTTDGVVALSPEVLRRMLLVLGPIDMPDYGVTIDANNFLPLLQEEVEVGFDKEYNAPKKILGDLTGVILERIVAEPSLPKLMALAKQVTELLNERHVMLYASHPEAEALIDGLGWSGKMLATPYDYLSVVHTNINGYKTDGVIDEQVEHNVSIQSDGSVVDTVSITRTHRGGAMAYEWWNKVNADYMRVYVPLGSELLSATGMTREFPTPPLDYAALGFRRDEDVVQEESKIHIDAESGTRIGEEFGKTVFGNWVYVSPGEQVTVTYRYRLPLRVALKVLEGSREGTAPFSILYQKQSGTDGKKLRASIEYPAGFTPVWQSPENLVPYERTLKLDTDLKHNVFVGTVFKNSTP